MDEGRAVVSVARFLLAVGVVVGMWLIALVFAFVGLLQEECTPTSSGAECQEVVSWVSLGIAAFFFLGSAPAGYLIAGRRWMLFAPLVPVVLVVGAGMAGGL